MSLRAPIRGAASARLRRTGGELPPSLADEDARLSLEDYVSLDGLSLAALVRSGRVTARELAARAFEAARRVNPVLNAVIELHEDRLSAPELRDAASFTGVPLLLKDLSVTEDGRLHECGCELFEGHVATRDSELVRRFRAAGFNLIGRTTTPELGWSASTECRLTGVTCNPWDPARSAGGSSGGSAAAVAAGVVPIAHASDGSGSIRNPAGWCGLVGLKTSRGRISAAPGTGMPPGARSVSFVVSRSLRDSAAALDAVHGGIAGDPFKVEPPARAYLEEVEQPPPRLRIAFTARPWNGRRVCAPVMAAFERTVRLLEDLGHEMIEARPPLDWAPLVDAILDSVAAGLAHRIDGVAESMDRIPSPANVQPTTWTAYRHGKSLAASRLLAAIEHLDGVSRQAGPFFEEYPVLLTPTSTDIAPLHGTHDAGRTDLSVREWSDIIHAEDCFLLLANVTGQPAMSLPLHESADGLPIGMHLMGRLGDEATLLQLGGELERSRPWRARRPRIHAALCG